MTEVIIWVGIVITAILIGSYEPPPKEYPDESWEIDREDLKRRRQHLEQTHDSPDSSNTPSDHRDSTDTR